MRKIKKTVVTILTIILCVTMVSSNTISGSVFADDSSQVVGANDELQNEQEEITEDEEKKNETVILEDEESTEGSAEGSAEEPTEEPTEPEDTLAEEYIDDDLSDEEIIQLLANAEDMPMMIQEVSPVITDFSLAETTVDIWGQLHFTIKFSDSFEFSTCSSVSVKFLNRSNDNETHYTLFNKDLLTPTANANEYSFSLCASDAIAAAGGHTISITEVKVEYGETSYTHSLIESQYINYTYNKNTDSIPLGAVNFVGPESITISETNLFQTMTLEIRDTEEASLIDYIENLDPKVTDVAVQLTMVDKNRSYNSFILNGTYDSTNKKFVSSKKIGFYAETGDYYLAEVRFVRVGMYIEAKTYSQETSPYLLNITKQYSDNTAPTISKIELLDSDGTSVIDKTITKESGKTITLKVTAQDNGTVIGNLYSLDEENTNGTSYVFTNRQLEVYLCAKGVQGKNKKVTLTADGTSNVFTGTFTVSDLEKYDYYLGNFNVVDGFKNSAYAGNSDTKLNNMRYSFSVSVNGETYPYEYQTYYSYYYTTKSGKFVSVSDSYITNSKNAIKLSDTNILPQNASSLGIIGWIIEYMGESGREYALVDADTYLTPEYATYFFSPIYDSVNIVAHFVDNEGNDQHEDLGTFSWNIEATAETIYSDIIAKIENKGFSLGANHSGWNILGDLGPIPSSMQKYMIRSMQNSYLSETISNYTKEFDLIYKDTTGNIKKSKQNITFNAGIDTMETLLAKFTVPDDAYSGTSFTNSYYQGSEKNNIVNFSYYNEIVAKYPSSPQIVRIRYISSDSYQYLMDDYALEGAEYTLPSEISGRNVSSWKYSTIYDERTLTPGSKLTVINLPERDAVYKTIRLTANYATSGYSGGSGSTGADSNSQNNNSASEQTQTPTENQAPAEESTKDETKTENKSETDIIKPGNEDKVSNDNSSSIEGEKTEEANKPEKEEIITPPGVEMKQEKLEAATEAIEEALTKLEEEIADLLERVGTDDISKLTPEERDKIETPSVTISMTQEDGSVATVVSPKILEAIAGKDIDVVLDMGGYSWTINGQGVDAEVLAAINLEVKTDSNAVDEELVNAIAGDRPTKQLSLTHEGEFGFVATLTFNFGAENAGQYGNLYYVDEYDNVYFMNAGKIREDGSTDLCFTHASDYVVVIGEEVVAEEGTDVTADVNETKASTKEQIAAVPDVTTQADAAIVTATTGAKSGVAVIWWILGAAAALCVIGTIVLSVKKKKE